tara:strand:- start:446 stop:934 length:489 start_codon:yes stop_codon:yes gene_type:complete
MTLLEKLTAAFAEADAKSIAGIPEEVQANREWFRKVYAKLREEFPINRQNYNRFYTELDRIASKQTQEDNTWGFDDHVEREIKRTKRTHENRNKRIAQKFEKAGIADIDSDDLVVIYGTDFCGEWFINNHHVKLQVIWAGGYNIQCYHCRVLCSVKKIKEAA